MLELWQNLSVLWGIQTNHDIVTIYESSFIFQCAYKSGEWDTVESDCIKRTVCFQNYLSGRMEPTPATSMFLVPSPSPAENFDDGSMEEPKRPEIKVYGSLENLTYLLGTELHVAVCSV
jgi:hypothetical protein